MTPIFHVLVVAIIFGGIFGPGVIWMLLKHQREMAELMRRENPQLNELAQKNASLEQRLQQLEARAVPSDHPTPEQPPSQQF